MTSLDMDIFIALDDYNKYFVDQLILSSTLLGLLIATSTFLLQSGFVSFEFSRAMFLKYYICLTKILFLLLGYNIVIPLIFLYTNLSSQTVFVFHVVYGLLFIKYLLDFYSHKGYILTVSSNKFNPFKKPILKYLRFITNLGFIQVVLICGFIFLIVIYPLWPVKHAILTPRQAFVSTIISFTYSVFALIRIIPQYFSFTEIEYKQKENNELRKEIKVDVTKELGILKDTLIKYGRSELEARGDFLELGEIEVSLTDKKDEAFFVIHLYLKTSDVNKIVRSIEDYSFDFFKDLASTNVDINTFVLSYFVKIQGVANSKTYFIRSKRSELDELISNASNASDFVGSVKNKVIDELFRGV